MTEEEWDAPVINPPCGHNIVGMVQMLIERQAALSKEVVELVERQRMMASHQAKVGEQLQYILEAMTVIAGSPSGFVGLAQDVRGSVRVTKRVWKLLLGGAAAVTTLWGLITLIGNGKP